MNYGIRAVALTALMAATLAACKGEQNRLFGQGRVELSITTVPSDVQCIQLTATEGSSTATRWFDVVARQSARLTGVGLPTGTVTLNEAAYDVPCSAVTSTTPPTWISYPPVVVQLVPGQPVAVAIQLVRPGSVDITNTFNDFSGVDGGAVLDGGKDSATSADMGRDNPIAPDMGPDNPIAADMGRDNPIAVDMGRDNPIAVDMGRDNPIAADMGRDNPIAADMGRDNPIAIDMGRDNPIAADMGRDNPIAADMGPDNPTAAAVYQINAGSTSAAGTFVADQYYSGGATYSVTNTITISGIANPAPAAVYQTERYGATTYTFPNLTAGTSYKVRLHFAELYQTASGRRLFNVAINGATVLSSFDVFAIAGGNYRAVLREFTTTASSSGQIIVAFTNITDNATIGGIEITR